MSEKAFTNDSGDLQATHTRQLCTGYMSHLHHVAFKFTLIQVLSLH